jgi:DNA-binding beta-propeller fold protein YncE
VLFATLTACGGAMPSHASRSRPVLAPPPCTSAGDQARRISSIRTAWVWVGREPFGVAMTPDGRWSFVSTARGLAVLSDRTFAPRLVRTLALPSATQGLALTPDGRYLLAADNGSGAIVIDARRAEQGEPHAMLGMLSSRAGEGAGAIEVSISPDGRYAFVSLEASGGLAAFDLQAAIAARFRSSGFVGTIPVKVAPVGVAVSRDGRWLYATSELAPGSNPLLPTAHGTLSVIDVKRAETDPARSVVATATAGCTPVRAAVSPDGQTVWVTARGSNALLGFSTARLLTRPTGALISVVRVGREPVGLALFDHGARALVADSNRSGRGLGELSIVGTWPTPGGRPSLLGAAPAGRFPRDIAIQPNGRTALVTSFGSGQLQIIDLSHTP